jgi:hypothetical protein
MAMSAPHGAPPDLAHQSFEALALSAQLRNLNLFMLRLDVVELEQERIRFSAVDARMCAKVVENESAVPNAVPAPSFIAACIMQLCILYIVMPAIERQACFAVRTPPSIRPPIKPRNRQF